MKPVYVFLADGFEEIEAITPIDVLRRGGMQVISVSVNADKRVTGAHGVAVEADTTIADVEFDGAEWLVCPGGLPGSTNLAECEKLTAILSAHHKDGGKIAAICAAPAVVLAPLGILEGRKATCYPGFEEKCPGAVMTRASVEASADLITGNGPAAALPFALAILAGSMGAGVAQEVAQGMRVVD